MHPPSNHSMETILSSPLGRRAVLALGARAAYVLTTTLGLGAATGLLQSLAGCQPVRFGFSDEFAFGGICPVRLMTGRAKRSRVVL